MVPITRLVQKEKGAVMILFAFLLITLFAFVALIVDTTLFTNSQSHLKTSADVAVLGALEEYGNQLSTSPTPAMPAAALTAARARASTQLGQNFNNNPGKFLQKQSGNTQNVIGTDCSASAPGNGCLRPINWYPPDTSPGCVYPSVVSVTDPSWRPCRCDESCECGVGCLGDPMAQIPETAGNGLKLIYRTDQNSPLKALFGSVIGLINGSGSTPEVGLTVTSSALLTPRNAIFLLDLSDSMISLAKPSGTFPASWYDYAVPEPTTNYEQRCNKRVYAYPMSVAGSCDPMNLASLGPRTDGFDTNANVSDPRNNFYNCGDDLKPTGQYTCFSGATSVNADFYGTVTPRQDNFFINNDVDPEPLTSALDAVNQAMNSFQSRRVPNDRLGIIGFDDERINNRILAVDNTAAPAAIQPAPLSDPEFSAFEQATRVVSRTVGGVLFPAIPITDNRRYSKYLFPRHYPKVALPGNAGDVGSDLPETFKLARNMIRNTANYRQAQNFVVMFSDGMTNCRGPLDPLPRCVIDQTHFDDSMALLQTELETNYVADRIAVHFLLLGSTTQPHRLAWKNSNGTCASIDEIADMSILGQNLPVVSAQAPFDSGGTPLVNQIYPWVKATGGIWAPVMDSYGVNSAGACNTVINQAAFDAACAGLVNGNIHSSLAGSGTSLLGRVATGGSPGWTPSPYWDSYGRITCDPQNRSTARQVNDIMKVILGKPPFVLVHPT